MVNSQPDLSQVLVKEENGKETFYVYGLGLIGEEKEGRYQSYHFDFRGSTVALTDEKGEVVERFGYGPYGEWVSGERTQTPFLFNGKFGVMSDGNGLYYMRARFYSPEMKRFVNQDILIGDIAEGQTLNRFAFVMGRPVGWVDPWGLRGIPGVVPILSGIRSPIGLPTPYGNPGSLPMFIPFEQWLVDQELPPFPYPIIISPIEIEQLRTFIGRDGIKRLIPNGEPLTCQIGDDGTHRNQCQELLAEIYSVIDSARSRPGSGRKGLKQRYQEQLNDPGNFYIDNPDAWETHNQKFEEDQKKLSKLIAQAKKIGCYVPPELEWWLTITPPIKPLR